MEKENRYLVVKRSDIEAALDGYQIATLEKFLECIARHRESVGQNPDKQYVVVSEDWPMYDDTWKAIEQWVDNPQSN